MADLNQIDLYLTRRQSGSLISDRETVDLRTTPLSDVATTTGPANLTQAILNRLLTRQGELAKLGHPDYGSRLHQLIGELNNSRTRILAEVYIREALAQESRIEEVTSVTAAAPSRGLNRDLLEMTIGVKPVGLDEILTIGLSLNLAG